MNLPFGITGVKESGLKKREVEDRSVIKYERKLADYRDTLESYKNCILEYSDRLDSYEKRTFNNQLSVIQTALDITYMKEQGDKVLDLLDNLKADTLNQVSFTIDKLNTVLEDTKDKVEVMDENIITNISELISVLQKETQNENLRLQDEVLYRVEGMEDKIRRSNSLIWFLFVFNIISLGALAFVILYIMNIIPLR